MPTELEIELNQSFQHFIESGQERESYFDRQIILIHQRTNRLKSKVKCSEIYNTLVFIPVISGKFFYDNVQIETIESDQPIKVSNIENLPIQVNLEEGKYPWK